MAKLKIAQHVALHKVVHEDFVISGKNDTDFAIDASAKLGFPVNRSHVAQARETYGIPSKRENGAAAAKLTIAARLDALEATVAALFEQVNGGSHDRNR